MADGTRFLDTNAGKFAVGILLLAAVGAGAWAIKGSMGASDAVAASNGRVFVDSATGKSFKMDLKVGMTIPVDAPSGGKTGYPAEMCWWTKEGKVRAEPFAVILNSTLGKAEPTFCPDCSRLVVGMNPGPLPDNLRPPPLQSEYKSPATGRDR